MLGILCDRKLKASLNRPPHYHALFQKTNRREKVVFLFPFLPGKKKIICGAELYFQAVYDCRKKGKNMGHAEVLVQKPTPSNSKFTIFSESTLNMWLFISALKQCFFTQ